MTMRLEAFDEHKRICPDFGTYCLGKTCKAFSVDESRLYWITVTCGKYTLRKALETNIIFTYIAAIPVKTL